MREPEIAKTYTPLNRVAVVTVALNEAQIQWVPQGSASRIVATHVSLLISRPSSTRQMAPLRQLAPPCSFMEASRRAQDSIAASLRDRDQPRQLYKIRFSEPLPFLRLPDLLRSGFEKATTQQRNSVRGADSRLTNHFSLARQTLVTNLGEPLCILLITYVLTLADQSILPDVPVRQSLFSSDTRHAKERDRPLWAAKLATKMAWYLYPEQFPSDLTHTYSPRDMNKKLETSGITNRHLVALGWINVVRTQRASPLHSESTLTARGVLLERYQDLMRLLNRAEDFIRAVFRSEDPVWFDRCTQIVQSA